MRLDANAQAQLLTSVRAALEQAVHGQRTDINPAEFKAPLQQPAATFVTLTANGRLRGCIGRLEAERALIVDATANTWSAAREDPRFSPVTVDEAAVLSIEVAVLSALTPLVASSRAQLLAQLQPRVDGLLLEDQGHRATYLPKVWEQLPEAEQFLDQLLSKAGLPAGYWSPTLRSWRYSVAEYD